MNNVVAPEPPATQTRMFAEADDDADDIFDLPEDEAVEGDLSASVGPDEQTLSASANGAPEPASAPEDSESEPAPPVGLRPYQDLAVKAVLNEFNRKIDSTLVVSATGTGKTVIIADLARRFTGWDHGQLFVVHRDELIDQIIGSLARVGIHGLKEKAENRALAGFGFLSKTVVASVQTLKGKRLEAWPRDAFRLIGVDECHRVCSPSYLEILNYFQGYKGVGFTATADRLDGKNIGQVYESLAFEYNIRDAIRDEWLVPLEALTLKTDPPVDLRQLRVTGDDFNLGDLGEAIQNNIGVLVNAVKDTNALEDRRTMAFTPTVGGAKALSLALGDIGITAEWVAGDDPQRAHKFRAHQRGDFQVLCVCELGVEGYDDPEISAVLMCRPTKSRRIYSQAVGRGTRRFPQHLPPSHPDAIKQNCRIVDFAFLTEKHSLVSPVDLFDNRETPDEVVARASELIAQGALFSIEQALEQAHEEFETEQRVKIQRRTVSVQAGKFNPVDACQMYGIQSQKESYDWQNVKPATPKQIEALRKWGVAAPDDMGAGVATQLLNKIFARNEHGWSSPREIANLMETGLDMETAKRMRSREAKQYLESHPLGPTPKQAKMLRWKGVSDAEIAQMTRKQASARIDALMKQ